MGRGRGPGKAGAAKHWVLQCPEASLQRNSLSDPFTASWERGGTVSTNWTVSLLCAAWRAGMQGENVCVCVCVHCLGVCICVPRYIGACMCAHVCMWVGECLCACVCAHARVCLYVMLAYFT